MQLINMDECFIAGGEKRQVLMRRGCFSDAVIWPDLRLHLACHKVGVGNVAAFILTREYSSYVKC